MKAAERSPLAGTGMDRLRVARPQADNIAVDTAPANGPAATDSRSSTDGWSGDINTEMKGLGRPRLTGKGRGQT